MGNQTPDVAGSEGLQRFRTFVLLLFVAVLLLNLLLWLMQTWGVDIPEQRAQAPSKQDAIIAPDSIGGGLIKMNAITYDKIDPLVWERIKNQFTNTTNNAFTTINNSSTSNFETTNVTNNTTSTTVMIRQNGGLLLDAGGLTLLTSCSDSQVLKWQNIGNSWVCASVPLSTQTETIASPWTFSSEITADGGLACTSCISLGTETNGDYVAGLTSGSGISITGSGGEGSTPTVALDSLLAIYKTFSADSGSATAGSLTDTVIFSGGNGITTTGAESPDTLTFDISLASGSGLGFLGGALTITPCSDGEIIKWVSASSSWECASDMSGSLTIQETDGTPSVGSVTTIQLGPVAASSDEFILSDEGSGTVRIRTGDAVPLSNQAETIASPWTFSSEIAADGGLACTDCIALGTETSGDYVSGLLSGSGISITGSGGEGSTPTVALDSSLAIFKTITADTGSAIADGLTDTLSILGGDGLSSTGADAPDSVTLNIDLASGSGLVFSGGSLSLLLCSDGAILKRLSSAWSCAQDDASLATAFAQQLAGTDNRTLSASLTPLLTNGSGTPQSLPITVTSGNSVMFVATVEASSSLDVGPITVVVIRDDNGDNDCVTGGGDGTQVGGQVNGYIASVGSSSTVTLSFIDTSPGTATQYQLCASDSIALGTVTATDRSLRLEEKEP